MRFLLLAFGATLLMASFSISIRKSKIHLLTRIVQLFKSFNICGNSTVALALTGNFFRKTKECEFFPFDPKIMFLRLITDREREREDRNKYVPLFFHDWHETLGADSCNLPEAPAALVHLVLCIRAMPICASVLQRLVIATTTLTKVGQLRCEGGCTGRGVAAWGGEVESDDSPLESRADPMKRRDYLLYHENIEPGNDSFPIVIAWGIDMIAYSHTGDTNGNNRQRFVFIALVIYVDDSIDGLANPAAILILTRYPRGRLIDSTRSFYARFSSSILLRAVVW